MNDDKSLPTAYTSIQDTQLKYWEKIRHPFVAGLELTPFCNLKCIHCYMNGYSHQRLIDAATWKVIIDKLYQAGILILYMTGGEIFSRNDFAEIYTYAKKKGFIIELLTNATLLDDDLLRVLEKYPPATVSISVYGTRRKTYESVTNVEGSFERFMANLERLYKANIDLELKFIGMQENVGDFHSAEQLAKKLHAKFKYNLELFPQLQGPCSIEKHQLSIDEIISLEASHPRTAAIYANNIKDSNPFEGKDSCPVFTCNVASTLCYIDCLGYVNPCHKMRLYDHNILNENLGNIWHDYVEKYAMMVAPDDYVCAKCHHIHICSPCPAINKIATGNYTNPSADYCKLAKKRTEEFSKQMYDKYRAEYNRK